MKKILFFVIIASLSYFSTNAASYAWTGALSSDWNNANNWIDLATMLPNGSTPTNCVDDVSIGAGATNYPIVLAGVVGAKNLTIAAGGKLTIGAAADLQICGDINKVGTLINGGMLTINGGVDQTLRGLDTVPVVNVFKAGGQFIIGDGVGPGVLFVGYRLNMIAGVLKATVGKVVMVSSSNTINSTIDDYSPGYAGTFFAGSNIAFIRTIGDPGVDTGIHYISSPVAALDFSLTPFPTYYGAVNGSQVIANAACDGLAPGSPFGALMDYREDQVTTCNLEGWHVRSSGNAEVGRGFSIVAANGQAAGAEGGMPNTGAQTSTITYNAGQGDGWNLIGNPYPSAVNWALVAAANGHIVGGAAQLYHSSGYYDGTYLPANLITAGNITAGQGFFVQVNAATDISWTNAMRTNGPSTFLSEENNFEYLISLKVEGVQGADKTIIAFDENFTSSDDFLLDANKMKSGVAKPTLYTNDWNTKQAIKAIPSITTDIVVVPMGLNQGTDGQFTISTEELIDIPKGILIFLEDKENGTFTNLRETNSYTFNMTAASDNERFNIHFVPQAEITTTKESCDGNDGVLTFEPYNYSINGNAIVWSNVVSTNNVAIFDFTNLVGGTYKVTSTYGTYEIENEFTVETSEFVTAGFEVDNNEVFVGDVIQITNNTIGNATYAWSFGDGSLLDNVSNPSYTFTDAGNYEIELEALTATDCSDDASVFVNVSNKTTAISIIDNKNDNKLFVNNKVLEISMNNMNNSSVKIFNLIGNLMTTTDIQNTKEASIDLSSYTAGYYLVTIQGATKNNTYKILVK